MNGKAMIKIGKDRPQVDWGFFRMYLLSGTIALFFSIIPTKAEKHHEYLSMVETGSAFQSSALPLDPNGMIHHPVPKVPPGSAVEAFATGTRDPILRIKLLKGTILIEFLSAENLVLQTATSLEPPVDWTPLDVQIKTEDGKKRARLPITDQPFFLRLGPP